MVEVTDLPHVLAAINGLTIVVLVSGFYCVRKGEKAAHKKFMMAALFLGGAFLLIYGYYKLNSGFAKFGGTGAIRPVYFSILLAHVGMAAVSLGLVPVAVWRALHGHFSAHKRLARWALPIWLFVAISGIVVYVMAVHLFPFPGGV